MINPYWLELPLSRTNLHGTKDHWRSNVPLNVFNFIHAVNQLTKATYSCQQAAFICLLQKTEYQIIYSKWRRPRRELQCDTIQISLLSIKHTNNVYSLHSCIVHNENMKRTHALSLLLLLTRELSSYPYSKRSDILNRREVVESRVE